MTGIQEILTLILLIVGLILIPRMLGGGRPKSPRGKTTRFRLDGKWRLAIVASLLFPLGVALRFPPWQPEHTIAFTVVGLLPVILGWAGVWILRGFGRPSGK